MGLPRRAFLFAVPALAGAVALALLILSWWLRPEENYSRIEDTLYLGGAVPSPPRGTRGVINLCELEDPYRCESHLWEPIPDAEPVPDLDWLRRMVAFLDDQQRAGATTYVHCRNGVSRSGMLVVAYEMWKYGWTRDEALAFVRARRPAVRPNPAFLRLLLDWERVVRGGEVMPSSATSSR